MGVEQLMAPDTRVRSLVVAVLEAARRRLTTPPRRCIAGAPDAALAGRGAASDGVAGAAGDARRRPEARRSLPLHGAARSIEHVSVRRWRRAAARGRRAAAPNATALSDSRRCRRTWPSRARQRPTSRRGQSAPARRGYSKLWTWVRERLKRRAPHGRIALGVRLDFAAFRPGDFLADAPMASQLVMGMDSTRVHRRLPSCGRADARAGPTGAGIQQAETEPKAPATALRRTLPTGRRRCRRRPRHVGHSHGARQRTTLRAPRRGVRGPGGWAAGERAMLPLGGGRRCVEVAHNQVRVALPVGRPPRQRLAGRSGARRYAAGWPIGGIASERCAPLPWWHAPTAAATAAAAAGQGGSSTTVTVTVTSTTTTARRQSTAATCATATCFGSQSVVHVSQVQAGRRLCSHRARHARRRAARSMMRRRLEMRPRLLSRPSVAFAPGGSTRVREQPRCVLGLSSVRGACGRLRCARCARS